MAGTKLHFESSGPSDAPAIVFLHGFMGSSADWGDVIDSLRDTFFCIAVDLPGHGQSVDLANEEAYSMEGTSKLIEAVIERAGRKDAHVVGYSMGGRLALYFALHVPDRCRRVVLESASPGLRTEADRVERRGTDEARAIRLETEEYARFLEQWYRQPLFQTLEQQEGLLERMIASRISNSPNELALSLRKMGTGRQPSLWGDLEDVRVPVLALAGALDGKYVELAERMSVLMPNARTAIIPNAGHNVHAEYPSAFRAVLKNFLEASILEQQI